MVKKWMVFILVAALLLALPFHAMAERPQMDTQTYLNLGDSIAAGMSADPGESYFDGYSMYLEGFGFEKVPGVPTVVDDGNIAIPGLTTQGLLTTLSNPMVQEMVKKADVVTVSIGGNNLLQPMIGSMMMEYGLNPYEDSIEDLLTAIAYRGEDFWHEITEKHLNMLRYAEPELCPLWQGVDQFQTDWPRIISVIHALNSDAHIIALSIYNPVSKMESPEFYQLMEELIRPMNQTMRRHQGRRVSVANVYNAFRSNEDAVNFSVTWFPNVDPHPTNIGHQLIVEELIKVRNPRAFR